MLTLNHFLLLSGVLFAIGTAGVFLRRNLITVLLSVEVMLNAVNLTFVALAFLTTFSRCLVWSRFWVAVFFLKRRSKATTEWSFYRNSFGTRDFRQTPRLLANLS